MIFAQIMKVQRTEQIKSETKSPKISKHAKPMQSET